MGGVGGSHLLTLVRLGIGRFTIADFDRFDVVNLNRQAGANMATLGRAKVDVLAEMALAINPEIAVTRFSQGVTLDNLDAFLAGCDLFVDGLDFFVLDIRARVFARCAELGIPAITAAPIGLGVGFLAFLPGRMTFEQYFRLDGQPEHERYLRFLLGVAPKGLHRAYLADDTRVDLAGRSGPSTSAACELCAGMVATQALKLLLRRGGVPAAPVHLHFDAYRGRMARSLLRSGNAGPLQRLKLSVGRRIYGKMAQRVATPAPSRPIAGPLAKILDLARWAPSGDNVQPWRFELVDDETIAVHLSSEAATNPYEYRDGEPGLLAGGMLLESIRIAASLHGRAMTWRVEAGGPPWRIVVHLPVVADILPDPLAACLPMRSVARKAFGARRLTSAEKVALQAALGPAVTLTWHEDTRARLRVARLGALATDIRLRMPETYAVHKKVIDWQRDRSPDGLPARATGLNTPTLAIMRWGMARWSRMQRLNAVLGTGAAALQLDLRPALGSAAYFVIRAEPTSPTESERVVRLLGIGERVQRFWLTATGLGLAVQPALATLIFADYGARHAPFTTDERSRQRASVLAERATAILGPLESIHFIGRIGEQRFELPGPRSVRKPLHALMMPITPIVPASGI